MLGKRTPGGESRKGHLIVLQKRIQKDDGYKNELCTFEYIIMEPLYNINYIINRKLANVFVSFARITSATGIKEKPNWAALRSAARDL